MGPIRWGGSPDVLIRPESGIANEPSVISTPVCVVRNTFASIMHI